MLFYEMGDGEFEWEFVCNIYSLFSVVNFRRFWFNIIMTNRLVSLSCDDSYVNLNSPLNPT